MKVSAETRTRLGRAKSINSGGELKDSSVTLTLYSPDINLPKLTALLGCKPTYSQVKGELRHPPHGSGPAPVGMWMLEAPKSRRFEDKIQYLLDATPSKRSIWRRLSTTHQVRLTCGIFMHAWNEGFELPVRAVAELGSREWKLGVDIYSAEGHEIVDAFLSKQSLKRAR